MLGRSAAVAIRESSSLGCISERYIIRFGFRATSITFGISEDSLTSIVQRLHPLAGLTTRHYMGYIA